LKTFAAWCVLALFACAALAQNSQSPAYEPSFGQDGKDVVWVPTASPLVERMLDMAGVTSKDFVMDLGSGDGRTVIAAAQRGARALGIEYNPDMVALSRARAKAAGVEARAEFRTADLFDTDLSQATVITMFLLPTINLKLRPTILKLKPGTRVVSNTFSMDLWEADEIAEMGPDKGCESWCKALMWIVPARVAGTYALPQGGLVLKQEFQMLSGTLTRDGTSYVLQGRVRGEEVAFEAGGRDYRGRMSGGKLILQ
jgi:SAM-dependent methyltransferase